MLLTVGAVLFGIIFVVNVGVAAWILGEVLVSEGGRAVLALCRTCRVAALAVAVECGRPRTWRVLSIVVMAGALLVVCVGQIRRVRTSARSEARIVYHLEPQEGLRAVKRGGLWGFVDDRGEQVIGVRFSAARGFSEGLAPVSVKSRWGFIDREGRFVVKPQYRLAGEYQNGAAPVGLDDYSIGYIDADGNMIARKGGSTPREEASSV